MITIKTVMEATLVEAFLATVEGKSATAAILRDFLAFTEQEGHKAGRCALCERAFRPRKREGK